MGNSNLKKTKICCFYTDITLQIEKDKDFIEIEIPENNLKINSKSLKHNLSLFNNDRNNLLNLSSLNNIGSNLYLRENSNLVRNNNDNIIEPSIPRIFSKSNFNKEILGDSIVELDKNLNIDKNVCINCENFSSEILLDEINKARFDILGYANLIEKYAKEIKMDENNKNYLLSKGKKIHFSFNKNYFLECANHIKIFYNNKSLGKLFINTDLNIPVPYRSNNRIIHKYINDLKIRFKDTYVIKTFLSFRTTADFEVALIIQIVKDFSRNKDVNKFFSEDINYVSINYKKIKEDMIGVYIILAK